MEEVVQQMKNKALFNHMMYWFHGGILSFAYIKWRKSRYAVRNKTMLEYHNISMTVFEPPHFYGRHRKL